MSGDHEEIKIGNFIGDYVKGRDYQKYPLNIMKGILIHREIDHYTDSHPVVQKSKSHLKIKSKRYTGIIIDVFYDHFLSVEWKRFSTIPLQDFIDGFNRIALKYYSVIPGDFKQMVPFFVINSWLEGYQSVEGIESVLYRMSNRTSLPAETLGAIEILKNDYKLFHKEFLTYFPSLISHIEKKMDIVIPRP